MDDSQILSYLNSQLESNQEQSSTLESTHSSKISGIAREEKENFCFSPWRTNVIDDDNDNHCDDDDPYINGYNRN